MTNDNGDWLKKYHAEHARYGGASHEFHARAQTWVATRDVEIARLTAERSDAQVDAIARGALLRDTEAEVAILKATIARLRAALAAGPATLEDADVSPRIVKLVEAAQEAALKEGK